MNKESKTRRLLFLVRIKNVLIFLIVILLAVWLIRLVYGQMGGVGDFWSFLDGLAE